MSMKTLKSSIVHGEASETETESEDDTKIPNNIHSLPVKMATSVQGAIITGEDSESDIDLTSSTINRKLESTVTDDIVVEVVQPIKKSYDSLLHRKLRENNLAVHKNINNFFTIKVSEGTTTLNGIEQQLMKSQLTLQGALNSLRNLNTNSIAIKNKLQDIVVDGNFLQNLAIIKK